MIRTIYSRHGQAFVAPAENGEQMAHIDHCLGRRRAVAYWLISNDKKYKHQILLVATCPKCSSFVLEWYGIDHKNRRTPQHRVSLKKHAEWIARTKTDLDEQMDISQWGSIKKGVYRVKASFPEFPWNIREVFVR